MASVAASKSKGLWQRLWRLRQDWPYYLLLILWCGFTLLVLFWVLYTSLKTNQELFANPWSLPTALKWGNYIKAWVLAHMGQYFSNSVIVVIASVVAVLAVSTPAAYALARIPFFGNNLVLYLFLAGMGIPVALLLVPLFMVMRSLHGVDTLWGLVLVYVAVSIPFTIFVLTGFFRTLPTELEEAAAIDGCSEFGIFWRIMMPLAQPGLVTAAIFNFVGMWSEYILALVLITGDARRTLPLGIYNLRTSMQYTADWVGLFAGVVIVMIPSMVAFVLLSEQIMAGLTLGATKG